MSGYSGRDRRWKKRGESRKPHGDSGSRDERDKNSNNWSNNQYGFRNSGFNSNQYPQFGTYPLQIPNPWQYQFFSQSWDQRPTVWLGQNHSNPHTSQHSWQSTQNYGYKSQCNRNQNSLPLLPDPQHSLNVDQGDINQTQRYDPTHTQSVEQGDQKYSAGNVKHGNSQKKDNSQRKQVAAKYKKRTRSPPPGSEEARKKAVAQAADKIKICLMSFKDQKPGVLEDLLSKTDKKKKEEAKSTLAVMDSSRFVPELQLTPKDWRDIGMVNTASASADPQSSNPAHTAVDNSCEASDVMIVSESFGAVVLDTVELDDSEDGIGDTFSSHIDANTVGDLDNMLLSDSVSNDKIRLYSLENSASQSDVSFEVDVSVLSKENPSQEDIANPISTQELNSCHIASPISTQELGSCHIANPISAQELSLCHIADPILTQELSSCHIANPISTQELSSCHIANPISTQELSSCPFSIKQDPDNEIVTDVSDSNLCENAIHGKLESTNAPPPLPLSSDKCTDIAQEPLLGQVHDLPRIVPRRARYTSETSHTSLEKPGSSNVKDTPIKLRARSSSLNVPEIQSDTEKSKCALMSSGRSPGHSTGSGSQMDHLKEEVIRQLLNMSKSDLKDMVNNPRSRKLEFAMKHLMKDHRMLLSRRLRMLAQARIQEKQEPESPEDNLQVQENFILDADWAVNLSTLPVEVIEQLGNILQMDLLDCMEPADSHEQVSCLNFEDDSITQGLEEFQALQSVSCLENKNEDCDKKGSDFIDCDEKTNGTNMLKTELPSSSNNSKITELNTEAEVMMDIEYSRQDVTSQHEDESLKEDKVVEENNVPEEDNTNRKSMHLTSVKQNSDISTEREIKTAKVEEVTEDEVMEHQPQLLGSPENEIATERANDRVVEEDVVMEKEPQLNGLRPQLLDGPETDITPAKAREQVVEENEAILQQLECENFSPQLLGYSEENEIAIAKARNQLFEKGEVKIQQPGINNLSPRLLGCPENEIAIAKVAEQLFEEDKALQQNPLPDCSLIDRRGSLQEHTELHAAEENGSIAVNSGNTQQNNVVSISSHEQKMEHEIEQQPSVSALAVCQRVTAFDASTQTQLPDELVPTDIQRMLELLEKSSQVSPQIANLLRKHILSDDSSPLLPTESFAVVVRTPEQHIPKTPRRQGNQIDNSTTRIAKSAKSAKKSPGHVKNYKTVGTSGVHRIETVHNSTVSTESQNNSAERTCRIDFSVKEAEILDSNDLQSILLQMFNIHNEMERLMKLHSQLSYKLKVISSHSSCANENSITPMQSDISFTLEVPQQMPSCNSASISNEMSIPNGSDAETSSEIQFSSVEDDVQNTFSSSNLSIQQSPVSIVTGENSTNSHSSILLRVTEPGEMHSIEHAEMSSPFLEQDVMYNKDTSILNASSKPSEFMHNSVTGMLDEHLKLTDTAVVEAVLNTFGLPESQVENLGEASPSHVATSDRLHVHSEESSGNHVKNERAKNTDSAVPPKRSKRKSESKTGREGIVSIEVCNSSPVRNISPVSKDKHKRNSRLDTKSSVCEPKSQSGLESQSKHLESSPGSNTSPTMEDKHRRTSRLNTKSNISRHKTHSNIEIKSQCSESSPRRSTSPVNKDKHRRTSRHNPKSNASKHKSQLDIDSQSKHSASSPVRNSSPVNRDKRRRMSRLSTKSSVSESKSQSDIKSPSQHPENPLVSNTSLLNKDEHRRTPRLSNKSSASKPKSQPHIESQSQHLENLPVGNISSTSKDKHRRTPKLNTKSSVSVDKSQSDMVRQPQHSESSPVRNTSPVSRDEHRRASRLCTTKLSGSEPQSQSDLESLPQHSEISPVRNASPVSREKHRRASRLSTKSSGSEPKSQSDLESPPQHSEISPVRNASPFSRDKHRRASRLSTKSCGSEPKIQLDIESQSQNSEIPEDRYQSRNSRSRSSSANKKQHTMSDQEGSKSTSPISEIRSVSGSSKSNGKAKESGTVNKGDKKKEESTLPCLEDKGDGTASLHSEKKDDESTSLCSEKKKNKKKKGKSKPLRSRNRKSTPQHVEIKKESNLLHSENGCDMSILICSGTIMIKNENNESPLLQSDDLPPLVQSDDKGDESLPRDRMDTHGILTTPSPQTETDRQCIKHEQDTSLITQGQAKLSSPVHKQEINETKTNMEKTIDKANLTTSVLPPNDDEIKSSVISLLGGDASESEDVLSRSFRRKRKIENVSKSECEQQSDTSEASTFVLKKRLSQLPQDLGEQEELHPQIGKSRNSSTEHSDVPLSLNVTNKSRNTRKRIGSTTDDEVLLAKRFVPNIRNCYVVIEPLDMTKLTKSNIKLSENITDEEIKPSISDDPQYKTKFLSESNNEEAKIIKCENKSDEDIITIEDIDNQTNPSSPEDNLPINKIFELLKTGNACPPAHTDPTHEIESQLALLEQMSCQLAEHPDSQEEDPLKLDSVPSQEDDPLKLDSVPSQEDDTLKLDSVPSQEEDDPPKFDSDPSQDDTQKLDSVPRDIVQDENSLSTLVSDTLSVISEGEQNSTKVPRCDERSEGSIQIGSNMEDFDKDSVCSYDAAQECGEGSSSKSNKHKPSRKHKRDKKTDVPEQMVFESHTGSILDIKTIGRHMLAACEDGNVYCYSLKSGKLKRTYEGHGGKVICLFILECAGNELDGGGDSSPDLIFTGSLDHHLRCFAFKTGALVQEPVNVGSPIQCMDQNWDTIFLGSKAGDVARFFIKSFKLADVHLKCSQNPILALKATKEGPRNVLIVATSNEPLAIRDATTGLLLRTVGLPHTVFSLLLDSSYVYCGTKFGQINMLSFSTGDELCKFQSGNGVTCMKIYNNLLFAGCYDGHIYIYSIQDQELLTRIPSGKMMLCMDVLKNRIIAGSKYKLQASVFPTEVRNYLKEAKHRLLQGENPK